MEEVTPTDLGAEPANVPEISRLEDLDATIEDWDPETGLVRYTTFYLFTSDDAVFGKLPKPRAEITPQEITDALERVLDSIVFPTAPHEAELTIAPDDGSQEHYIRRSNMGVYELFSEDDFLARMLLAEASIMERVARHPHTNIVRYHGIRVRRGRVTGLVLEKYQRTLLDYVKICLDLDKEKFLEALESAVTHLHSLVLAHNDINPENIMVDSRKMPILIDFGSCHEFGTRIMTQGTPGWMDVVDSRSGRQHDIYGLSNMREWFDDPWF